MARNFSKEKFKELTERTSIYDVCFDLEKFKRIEHKIEEVERQNLANTSILKQRDKDIKVLKEERTSLLEQIEFLKNRNGPEASKINKDHERIRFKEVSLRNQDLEKTNKSLQQENQKLSSIVENQRIQEESIKLEREKSQLIIKRLKNQIEELQANDELLKSRKKVEGQKKEIARLEQTVKETRQEAGLYKTETEKMKADFETVKKELKTCEGTISLMKVKLKENTDQLKVSSDKCDKLQEEKQKILKEHELYSTETTRTLKKLEQQYETMAKNESKFNNQLETYKTKLAEKDQTIKTLADHCLALEKERDKALQKPLSEDRSTQTTQQTLMPNVNSPGGDGNSPRLARTPPLPPPGFNPNPIFQKIELEDIISVVQTQIADCKVTIDNVFQSQLSARIGK